MSWLIVTSRKHCRYTRSHGRQCFQRGDDLQCTLYKSRKEYNTYFIVTNVTFLKQIPYTSIQPIIEMNSCHMLLKGVVADLHLVSLFKPYVNLFFAVDIFS